MFRRPVITISLSALVLSACAGPLGVTPGDAVVPPELAAPTIEIVTLAADDLAAVPSTVLADGIVLPQAGVSRPTIVWEGAPIDLRIEADGFRPSEFTVERYPDGGRIEFRLEPVVLTGRVTTDVGRPLPGALVRLGNAKDTTDSEGRYALERVVPGMIQLSRPAWVATEMSWGGDVDQFDMSMSPRIINALRVAPDTLLDADRWNSILALADGSGINALAIDIKTEDGTVVYPTTVPVANSIGAVSAYFDAQDIVSQGHDRGLYMIARIGVFQDSFYAEAEPERAVTNVDDGTLWRSRNGYAWLDPTDPASFEYSIALAEEACSKLGFDEVEFENVSFPIGGDLSKAVFDGEYTQEIRVASISAFLTRAYSVLHPMGCTVSTSVLGIVLESTTDEGVGQRPSSMSRIVDVLTPTLYTTNYGSGWKGFENPDDNAVEIVTSALAGGRGKMDGHGYLRPWLQTWAIDSTAQRSVQEAVTEAGMGWMLWSNNARYSPEALPPRP